MAMLPEGGPPLLLVFIDTEEDFDWRYPHSRENTSVRSISAQARGQEVFARYDIVPTYVVDHPVANNDDAVRVLEAFSSSGACEIGAHLHPWVNPPHLELVTAYNSYPGNLPPDLEREKLDCLTSTIATAFGTRPLVYRAGRYGLGPSTAKSLEDLGYLIDSSVVPFTSFAGDGGPDFGQYGFGPYWFGSKNHMLEIPLSCGFHGLLSPFGRSVFPFVTKPLAMRARLPGLLSRLGLLERIRLTPEGVDICAMVRLTEALLTQGCRVFCFSYHSPSLEPGNTPYVRDDSDLRDFLTTIDGYFNYFVHEKGGVPTTPQGLYRMLRPEPVSSAGTSGSALRTVDVAG